MSGLRRAGVLFALCLALVGCANLSESDRSMLAARGVSPAVYMRMSRGERLAMADFVELSRRHVPTAFVIRFLRSSAAVYHLTSDDVVYLRRGGVDRAVIDYLLQTPRAFAAAYYDPFWYGYDPLWWDYGPVVWHGGRDHRDHGDHHHDGGGHHGRH